MSLEYSICPKSTVYVLRVRFMFQEHSYVLKVQFMSQYSLCPKSTVQFMSSEYSLCQFYVPRVQFMSRVYVSTVYVPRIRFMS